MRDQRERDSEERPPSGRTDSKQIMRKKGMKTSGTGKGTGLMRSFGYYCVARASHYHDDGGDDVINEHTDYLGIGNILQIPSTWQTTSCTSGSTRSWDVNLG